MSVYISKTGLRQPFTAERQLSILKVQYYSSAFATLETFRLVFFMPNKEELILKFESWTNSRTFSLAWNGLSVSTEFRQFHRTKGQLGTDTKHCWFQMLHSSHNNILFAWFHFIGERCLNQNVYYFIWFETNKSFRTLKIEFILGDRWQFRLNWSHLYFYECVVFRFLVRFE